MKTFLPHSQQQRPVGPSISLVTSWPFTAQLGGV
jgi:hypothetical protein